MKAKHQRLILIMGAVIILVAASLLAIYALRNQASYFYTPSELTEKNVEVDRAIRLGGMVQLDSIKTANDGITVNFLVGDGEAIVPVSYRGITPDLFVEGSGVVAEGRLNADGVFVADNLLAKHDENYMPRELDGIDKTAIENSTSKSSMRGGQ
ncbi:cytochrome c maturation protein CcmE [Parasphingorhabdus sp. DH2-15]|uniref:cytochrome c maturation protein CcmE n=1 Tax=Parasphingorhabdus sp. DH2-15 TaxID=3444112 RepID=UPI003F689569